MAQESLPRYVWACRPERYVAHLVLATGTRPRLARCGVIGGGWEMGEPPETDRCRACLARQDGWWNHALDQC